MSYIVATPERSFDAAVARERFKQCLKAAHAPPEQLVVISAEDLSGALQTGGHDSMQIAGRLRAVLPDARVFWLVRNQIDMVESTYRQLIAIGFPGKIDDLFAERRWVATSGFDLGHFEYDALLARYQELFGHERISIYPYEHMRADPLDFLARLSSFLDVQSAPLPVDAAHSVVHRSLSVRGLTALRIANRFRMSDLNPYPVVNLGMAIHRPLRRLFKRFPKQGTVLSEDQREMLRDRFRESNRRLAALTEEDLSPMLQRME